MMKIQYDAEVDAMSIDFGPGGRHIVTREVAPGIYLDFDGKKLVGLEVLNASQHMSREMLEKHPYPVEYMTLAEASKKSGLSPVTLRRQINEGRISAVKRGRDWLVDELSLINYLESRSSRGRPPARGKRKNKIAGRSSKKSNAGKAA